MWHWRRDFQGRKRAYRFRWGRRLYAMHPCWAEDWKQLSVTVKLYRNARDLAVQARATLRHSDTPH